MLLAVSAIAFAEAPQEHPVQVELISEHGSIQPGGTTRIGALFTLQEGWHIYADPPGDAGLPTKIEWLPIQGAQFSPAQWPTPHKFLDPGDIKTVGYEREVAAVSALTLLAGRAPGTETIAVRAKVSWLACKEVCIPGTASPELLLPVSADPPTPSAQWPLSLD